MAQFAQMVNFALLLFGRLDIALDGQHVIGQRDVQVVGRKAGNGRLHNVRLIRFADVQIQTPDSRRLEASLGRGE